MTTYRIAFLLNNMGALGMLFASVEIATAETEHAAIVSLCDRHAHISLVRVDVLEEKAP